MRFNLIYITFIMLAFISLHVSAQRNAIISIRYGACLYSNDSIRGTRTKQPFPMHSVMKFPQAIFVADCLRKQNIQLHETILIRKEELTQNTWSPMLKMFDNERLFSYAELIKLSLAESDNNACDILFKLFGGPEKAEKYIHQLGFGDINIKWTEREMGVDICRSADNNCTPEDLVRLFKWFYQHKDQDEYLRFVWQTMKNCQTGAGRIASVIPKGAVFVHKTGTGFPSKDNRQDRNDAGIIILPNGKYQIIAIFAPDCQTENDVAAIGKIVLNE